MRPLDALLDELLNPPGPPLNEVLNEWLWPPMLNEPLNAPLAPPGPALNELDMALL